MLTLAAMEVKLGYLADENVPINLVFNDRAIHLAKSSEISQTIVDKLTKVKGKKIRKTLISLSS
jgi:hypothetical protein